MTNSIYNSKFKRLFLALLLAFSFVSVYPVDYMVSGAGTTAVNGTYVENGTYYDYPKYTFGDYNLYYDGMFWYISEGDFNRFYYNYNYSSTPPSTGWQTYMGLDPAPTVAIAGPIISYSSSFFNESTDNDGSISSITSIRSNNFAGLTFTGTIGDDFIADGKILISNLPAGLKATITKIDDLTLTLQFHGFATNHSNANDVNNLSVTFQNSAFTNTAGTVLASDVTNYSKTDFGINFFENYTVGVGQNYETISGAMTAFKAKGKFGNNNILHLTDAVYSEGSIKIYNSVTILGLGVNSTIVQSASTIDASTGSVFYHENDADTVIIKNLSIQNGNALNNGSYTSGGGYINMAASGVAYFYNVAFHNNKGQVGGAVYGTEFHLYNCLLSGNTAISDGGAIYATRAYLINTTISHNTASGRGGGICIIGNTLNMLNSTVSQNSTTNKGGGIYSNFGTITLENSILTGNIANGIANDYMVESSSTPTDNGHNIIGYQTGTANASQLFLNSTDILYNKKSDNTAGTSWSQNNVDLINQNLNLSTTLADNSTLNGTQTLALTAGSFAIDTGSDTNAPGYDQRFMVKNGTRDIGAFEYNGSSPLSTLISTSAASNLSLRSVTLNGNITDLGSILPTSHGFCWTTGIADPTIYISQHDLGSVSSTGVYTYNLNKLIPGATYKVRAYASNIKEAVYGATVSFTVPVPIEWTGSTNTDFGTAGNWTGSIVPSNGDNIKIASTATNNLVLDQNRTLGDVDFNANINNVKFDLGNYDLTATSISGSDINHYFKTTGTGSLRLSIADESLVQFPLGITDYTPVKLINHCGSSDVFGVNLTAGVTFNGSSNGTALTDYLVNRTMKITKTNANAQDGYDLYYTWNDANKSNITTPQIFGYDASINSWKKEGATVSNGNNAQLSNYTGSATQFFVGNMVDLSWNGTSYSPAITPAFYTNLTLTGNLSTNELTANNLTLNPGNKLTFTGNGLILGDLLLKCTDVAGDAQILNNGTFAVKGQTILEKKFELGKWYFFSLPFTVPEASIYKVISGTESLVNWGDPFEGAYQYGYDLYVGEYDGYNRDLSGFPANSSYWVNLNTRTLVANKGYIMALAGVAPITFRFKSTAGASSIIGGDKQLSVSKYVTSTNLIDNSWNLIGNPYSSGFDLTNATNHKPYYIFNGSTYSVVIGDGSDLQSTRTMSPYSSMFLQAADAANTLDFGTAGQALKTPSVVENLNYDVISLSLSKDGVADLTRIRLGNDFKSAYELGKDAAKIKSLNSRAPQISSVLNGLEYAVNSVPTTVKDLQLRVFCPTAGSYSLDMSNLALCPDLNACELIDTKTSARVDLLNVQKYEFTSDAGSFDRFSIHMMLNNTTDINGLTNDNVKTWSEGADLVISGVKAGNEIHVYNLAGILERTQMAQSEITHIQMPTRGLYVVRIIGNAGIIINH